MKIRSESERHDLISKKAFNKEKLKRSLLDTLAELIPEDFERVAASTVVSKDDLQTLKAQYLFLINTLVEFGMLDADIHYCLLFNAIHQLFNAHASKLLKADYTNEEVKSDG